MIAGDECDRQFEAWLDLAEQRNVIIRAASLAGVLVYADPDGDAYRMRKAIQDAMDAQWIEYLYARSVRANAVRAEQVAFQRWTAL